MKLQASDKEAFDEFGASVSISGDRAHRRGTSERYRWERCRGGLHLSDSAGNRET